MLKCDKKIFRSIDDTLAFAVLEIRFDLSIDPKELLSKTTPVFLQEFPDIESINNEVPLQLRLNDPVLKYMSEFRFKNKDFVIGLGRNSLQLEYINEYNSWKSFYDSVQNVLSKFLKLKIISNIHRVGLRYFNVVEGLPWEEILDINLNPTSKFGIDTPAINSRFEYSFDNLKANLALGTKVKVERKLSNKKYEGFLIDIDVFKEFDIEINQESLFSLIDELHDNEKVIFTNCLSQKFIDSRNPKY